MKFRRVYDPDVLLARPSKKATMGKNSRQLKKKLVDQDQWKTGEETTLTTSS